MLLLTDVVDIDILRSRDQGLSHQSQNKINQVLTVAKKRMTTKRPFATVLMTSLAMAQLAAARAADPGFCRQYARFALDQVRAGLSDPACGGALQGTGGLRTSPFITNGASASPFVPPATRGISGRTI